jgi:hypothetical protein
MSQPPLQQPPQPMYFPTNPPSQPAPKKHPWSGRWAFATYGLLLGLTLSALAFGGGSGTDAPTAAPAPTVTTTVTAAAPATTTEAPADEPTGYTADKADWRVGVKVKEQQCFGSAGCSVTVTIDPQYVGPDPLPDSGTVEVTYELSGDTSGPVVGTFTVEGGQVSYDKETDLDTKSAHTKIAAKVTDATYSG